MTLIETGDSAKNDYLPFQLQITLHMSEYCVCEATVVGFLKGGYTEVKLVGKNPGGFNTPYHYKMAEVGSKVFFDAHSAAKYAESLTVYAEQHWNWAGEQLRRPYKDLLREQFPDIKGGA